MVPARRCVFAPSYLLHAALGAECALTLANGTKGAGKTEVELLENPGLENPSQT